MKGIIQIQRGERAAVVRAFLTLVSLMAGHALLETARDALFLQNLPVEHLPWVYLVIAAIAALSLALAASASFGLVERDAVPHVSRAAAGTQASAIRSPAASQIFMTTSISCFRVAANVGRPQPPHHRLRRFKPTTI